MEVQAAEAGFVVLDRIRPGMGEATLRDGLIARIMIPDRSYRHQRKMLVLAGFRLHRGDRS
jgi:hypothetical protein